MKTQNLHFNLLSFDYPEKAQTFYFSKEKSGKCAQLHKSSFPNNIEELFPGITTDGTEFIYSTFKRPAEGFLALNIDFPTENENLLRRYYNRVIHYYFSATRGWIVKQGFIGENQVWARDKSLSTKAFTVYHKFSFKVQFCKVSHYPELLLSYDGKSTVLKTDVARLSKTVSTSLFNWVIKDNKLCRLEELEDPEGRFQTTFPVLNRKLAKALSMAPAPAVKTNKYATYLKRIKVIFDHILNTEDFRKLIPLREKGFMEVPEHLVSYIPDESNDLVFKDHKTGRSPKNFWRLKPFKECPHKKVHLFFIYGQEHEGTKDLLKKYLEEGLGHYPGLTSFAGILFHTNQSKNICFKDKDSILGEVGEYFINQFEPEAGVKYLALYLTPFSKDETRNQEDKIYARIKEMLVQRGIALQCVEPETVEQPNDDFKWSLTTMSVTILAKLDGIPWRLNVPVNNELIVGVGAFRHANGVEYLSGAFSFDNTGQFNEFDYFRKKQTRLLAGCIAAKLRQFAENHGNPSRLIIHFYKQLSEKELAPIEAALKELKLPKPIPIFIVTVNKTEAEDIIAYDCSRGNPDLMPYSGTYIGIGNRKYLLFNNSRFVNGAFSKRDGFPFPIKLAIDCTDKEQLNNPETVHMLINQVYQFSRMYYKSLSQQNMPVTIKYAEMVAEVAPYFEHGIIPEEGKMSLWFL